MMTPDELRRWAKGYELQGRREIADILDGAAAAWEKAELDLRLTRLDRDALRKRLEAAEKENAVLRCHLADIDKTLDAALAGERGIGCSGMELPE